jgi:tetratricopeptide (TPR) repeat protein
LANSVAHEDRKEVDMTELIKVIVSIKDPFTLLAFFAVVLLIAFRTSRVPEAVFRLLGQKIGRDRFYVLLNRMLLYAFAVFVVLCGIAVLGQVLSYKTTARAASVEELKGELALREASDSAAQRAIAEYQKALVFSSDDKLSEAITSLEASLKAVPTATARETLALLYQKVGNRDGAIRLAEQAVSEARESGDAVKTAKGERLLAAVKTPPQLMTSQACPPGAGLVGVKLNLPPGGDNFETSPLLVPCVYIGQFDAESSQPKYYKVALKSGQTLKVVLRTRGANARWTEVTLHGPNGGNLGGQYSTGVSVVTKPLEYKAAESGAAYVSLSGGVRGLAMEISVQ